MSCLIRESCHFKNNLLEQPSGYWIPSILGLLGLGDIEYICKFVFPAQCIRQLTYGYQHMYPNGEHPDENLKSKLPNGLKKW